MRCRQRTIVAVVALVALAAVAPAQFNRTGLFINVPTAEVLPGGTLAFSLDGSIPQPWMSKPNINSPAEMGAAIRFAPVDRLELALTAYTLKDYVLGASWRVLGEPGRAGLAVGIHDIGLNAHVSPIGNGLEDAWEDWKYTDRPKENFSAFAVGTLPIGGFARAHLGLGRGRFVGYSRGRYINTDIFFDGHNDWAFGLFGGVDVSVARFLSVGFDFDGRDVNAGLKATAGPVVIGLAATKLEGLTPDEAEYRFGRIALGVEYQLNLRRERRPVVEPEPVAVVPEPEPEPEPELPALALEPMYFAFDRSEIRPGDGEILQSNAGVIKAWVEAGRRPRVVVEGHCCPLGTAAYNMALGMRRAESAKRYLVNLGVEEAMLSTISYGEERLVTTVPAEYHRNRRCEFGADRGGD